ncbi:MAG TPA: bifunctional riboflavin kinase/FAD synthetase [Actinomycetota bacterium]|nr:bifunctional riboflavin kinase/FAD synthetase [Actinomycetota bacterium]
MGGQIVGLENLSPPEAGSAITIGTFDGVHLGHRALIAKTIGTAQSNGLSSAIITWDRHPNETIRPDRVPPLITTPARKVELLTERRSDVLVTLAFDKELSQWPPERFAEEVLAKGLNAKAVIVGEGWRFGRKAKGDADLLAELGARLGFTVETFLLEAADGQVVSSSRVRSAIADGDMELAHQLLARPFDMDGEVIHGDDRGRSLGFPTANLSLDPALVGPARGVYAGRARVGGSWLAAAVNVGVNPTFGGDPATTSLRVEAFLLDFEGDLYGQTIRIEFHERLRDEQRFDSVEALVDQMRADVEATRGLIAGP